jgi:serine/threonine protein kinase
MPSLGKYALIQQLGVGSMGTVYLARDSILDREVALKTIRTSSEVDAEIRERFYREARTCARLQHPNIVTVFDLGEQDNFAYIAMELLIGSDFRKIIERRGQIDLILKIDSMIRICEALGHAHQQGIIHRDVKPSNLFLCKNGLPKVLDFGIARLPSSHLTMVGRVLGTPNYMAPEQIRGDRSDGRADLFSTAVVFFEFLTYHHPFQSDLVPRRIVDSEPDSLFDHDSSLPLPLEPVFARGLAKDPDSRYTTGEEFANDLRAVADGLRQNSSPLFSKFPLPSLRAPVAAAPTTVPILNPIDVTDPADKTLPQFLRVLATFDSAIESGDLTQAHHIFQDLRGIAGSDERFNESLRISQGKISRQKSSPESLPGKTPTRQNTEKPDDPGPRLSAPASLTQPSGGGRVFKTDVSGIAPFQSPAHSDGSLTRWIRQTVSATETGPSPLLAEKPGDSESAGVLCERCATDNRVDASFCIGCGRSLSAPLPVPVAPAVANATAPPPATSSKGTVSAATKATLTPWLATGLAWLVPRAKAVVRKLKRIEQQPDRGARTVAAVAAAAILALLVIFRAVDHKQVPLEPHIGTAVVQNRYTKLLKSMNGSAPVVASLVQGTAINILAIPPAGPRNFWLVQPILGAKALSKGYVDGAALSNWNFATSAAALSWARRIGLSEGEPGSEPENAANALHSVVTRFPGTREAEAAALEEAGLYLRIGTEKKLGGRAEETWRADAEKASALITPLLPSPQATDILRQLTELSAPTDVPKPVPDPVASAESEDARDLARAQQLKANYDYDGSIRILNQFLNRHPGNSKAQQLLSDAEQARDLERGKL